MDPQRHLLVAGVLLGVAFSILGQGMYDILRESLSSLLPFFYPSYVKFLSAVPIAIFFFWLGRREFRLAKEPVPEAGLEQAGRIKKKEPTFQEAEEWVKTILNEDSSKPLQLGLSDKVALYSAFVQYRYSRRAEKWNLSIYILSGATLLAAIIQFAEPVGKLVGLLGIVALLLLGSVYIPTRD